MPPCSHAANFFNGGVFYDKYQARGYAGEGGHSAVFVVKHCPTGETVVIKMECGVNRTIIEHEVYSKLQNIPGIPRYLEGFRSTDHGFIVLEYLGSTLYDLLRGSGGVLPIDNVHVIGRAMVGTLREVHTKGIVHRDIKPDNIMLPSSGRLEPYLIDFGHATSYEDGTGKWGFRPLRAVGTLPFMSVNVQTGEPHTRRDDIVSLAYTLIYLAHGTLPWYRCKDARECCERKKAFHPSTLTPPLPSTLGTLLDHAQNLDLEEEPDYSYMETLLQGQAGGVHL